jgi:beta-lactamase class D
MKIMYTWLLVVLFTSCINNKKNKTKIEDKLTIQKNIFPEFQAILDSANVEGSILIFDSNKNNYYSNNYKWTEKGKLPASTFKIANSIIALETKVVDNDTTIFKWNGETRYLQSWEQDLSLKEAFHLSCVPCYQEVARKIGIKRMKSYLKKLNYGAMVVNSNSIDNFWLSGESKINQLEQIHFLLRFYNSELPISKRTEEIMKQLMVIEENKSYKISGKTGWSIRNGNNNGWFVGYLETNKTTFFFATNINPQEKFNMKLFPLIRKEITYKAFKQMKII